MVVEALAASVVANFLLPYAKAGVEALAGKIAEGAGKATAEQAESITEQVWARVRRLFSANQKEAVLDSLKDAPDAMKPGVEAVLDKLLKADPEARRELAELVGATDPGTGESIANIVHNAGVAITVQNSHVSHSTLSINQGTQR